jgi:putative ABC transport system permease protein
MSRRTADSGPGAVDIEEGNGGMAARRAVVRWAWRLFRREWRQQALVLVLLVTTVAGAVTGVTVAHNSVTVADAAEFGTARSLLRFKGDDPAALAAVVTAARARFGTVDPVHLWYAPVPGSVKRIEYRAQDPAGPFGASTVALRSGRLPTGAGEVALSQPAADLFHVAPGATIAADGTERRIVGIVENPQDLRREAALVPAGDTASARAVTLLLDAPPEAANAFLASGAVSSDLSVETAARSRGDELMVAAVVLGIVQLSFVLVALVAAAGFVVVAHRRLRQLGMLGSIGATERNLRLVLVANGAVVGVVAAGLGTALGLGAWMALASPLETTVGYRVDRLDVPWLSVLAVCALVIVTTTAAAWWPARAAARMPINEALSGRPPQPRPARHSAVLALTLFGSGVVVLAVGGKDNPLAASAGAVLTLVGVLLASPLAIRALARSARWFPVAFRVAMRDLARHQARSAVALAAISLVLGVPVAITVVASASQHTAGEGNLGSHQLLIRSGDPSDPGAACPGPVQAGESGPCPFIPERSPAELARQDEQVHRIASALPQASIEPFDVVFDPGVPAEDGRRVAVALAVPSPGDAEDGPGLLDVSLVYVATPELLAHYGTAPDDIAPGTEILTVDTRDLVLTGTSRRERDRSGPERVRRIDRLPQRYTSLPGSFVTAEEAARRGWQRARAGWLIETDGAVSDDFLTGARSLAADAGLLVESRDEQRGLQTLRTSATVAGVLLALGILAMTVGLIRAEAGRDLAILAATGASSMTRRTITAVTAGALGLLGVILGTFGAYLALGAGYLSDIGSLLPIPLVHLLALAVGVPLVGFIAGWFMAGREPRGRYRRPAD